ncbi:aminoglycoside phosphotransferase family protein [Streptomyces sp. NPDC002553]|uniref:aminoglycoside phosphotransferase family protein n=1 Tax=Streptomyces sp. NPDC002553 TaxID=3154417 RepID=UPI00332816F9
MTHAASLPPDLHQWVTRHVAGMDTAAVTDASWPREDSRVWRVRTHQGEVFVKLYPSTEKYEREVKGCEHAARALAGTEAPHLLASDPQRPAVVLSALPGRVVRGLPLEQAEEQRVHRLAGDLLRRWHDADEPISYREHQRIMESVAAQADEAAMILERLGDQLSPAEQDLVSDAAHDLPDLAPALPLAYRHGDYSPRNWLWDEAAGHHGLIDFEESAPGLAVEDLVWLCGAAWPTRPDLRDAFLTGYGRLLSPTEQRALVLLTARLGVSYLSTGLTKTDRILIDRGRTVLQHMVRAPR